MGFLDRLAQRFGYARPAHVPGPGTRAMHAAMLRAFQAAKVDRLTTGFSTASSSINRDLVNGLETLRTRSRELAQNNDYAKKFLQLVTTNVVGPSGFALQMQCRFANGDLDASANAAIERAWYDWCRRGVCDVSGRMSFVDVQQLAIETAARDGEYLVRRVWSRDVNRYGFALQVLEVDRLDVKHNEVLANGNRVIMGVEIAPTGAPVAYYLQTGTHPADAAYVTRARPERVPADDIYHGFRSTRPEQVRGFPWTHTAMLRLHNLGAYEEAAVIAARVGAAKMGWIVSPDGTLEGLGDDKDQQGNVYTDVQAGVIGMLPPGYDFKSFDPDYPHAAYGPFTQAALRGISSGLGVAYHSLANDLTAVNYSSMRGGTLDERDNWSTLQGWFSGSFLYPVFADWLRASLLQGAITLRSGSPLPLEKYGYFNQPLFIGRRWSWVDPKNDLEAMEIAIRNRLKSRRQIMAEQGLDLEDTWDQIAAEQALAATLDLDLPDDVQPAAAPAGDSNGLSENPAA